MPAPGGGQRLQQRGHGAVGGVGQGAPAPLRQITRAGANSLLGLGALLLVNLTAPLTGVSLGFNLFNALVTLVLGVPGLGLLLLVQWVLT